MSGAAAPTAGQAGFDIGRDVASKALIGALLGLDAGNITSDEAVETLATGVGGWLVEIVRSDLPPEAIGGRVTGVLATLTDLPWWASARCAMPNGCGAGRCLTDGC